jgi:hypothetical protein
MDKGKIQLPGRELPKEYRAVAVELVLNQGWRYEWRKTLRHPRLLPADRTARPITCPTTPSDKVHGFKNWIAEIRRAGGVWPPERK